MQRIVFLDRDGTISIDKGYTVRPEDLKIFPGAGTAIARFKRAGYKVVIVTNQSAIARKIGTLAEVEATNKELLQQLKAEDTEAQIDAIRLCPHHPDDNCACRKPKTGMVEAEDFPFEFEAAESWMIGDRCLDLEFGLALGIPLNHCILLGTGSGSSDLAEFRRRWGELAGFAESLSESVEIVLKGNR